MNVYYHKFFKKALAVELGAVPADELVETDAEFLEGTWAHYEPRHRD